MRRRRAQWCSVNNLKERNVCLPLLTKFNIETTEKHHVPEINRSPSSLARGCFAHRICESRQCGARNVSFSNYAIQQ